MTKAQKIKNIITALLMFVSAAILVGIPEYGYIIILCILDIVLFIVAIRSFIYYFTMARFMVDGRRILYKALLILDLAIFCSVLMNIPGAMVIAYLVCLMGFSAVIDLVYGVQAKKLGSPVWKKKIVYGSFELVIVILCFVFAEGTNSMVYLFAVGIVYSAFTKLADVFRRPEVVKHKHQDSAAAGS